MKQVLANQKKIMGNQAKIIKNQQSIIKNQGKLDMIIKNQKLILQKLKR